MTRHEPESLFRRVFRLPASRARIRVALDEELRFHLEGRTEELEASGLTHAEAVAEAYRRFGDVDAHRRAALAFDDRTLTRGRRMELVDAFLRECRLAVRTLARSPGFTGTSIITLGVGLGAATAIFTMLDAVVLRPLPYANADRLVQLTSPVPKLEGDTLWGLARHEMYYFKQHSTSIEDIGVYQRTEVTVGSNGGDRPAERARAVMTSPSLFSVLGVVPELGRLLLPDDSRSRRPAVVVLGHDYWTQRFGGDGQLVGKTIDVEGASVLVVGVLPPNAQLPDSKTDLWLPAYTYPEQQAFNNHTWSAIARLRPGITAVQAQRELAPLTARLPELYSHAEPPQFVAATGFHTQVRSLRDVVVGEVMTRALWILFGAVLLVLIIAAANLSSLFLIRVDARRRETAVRTALGADRVHAAMQLLSESVLIALAAALLAMILAQLGLRLLLSLTPSNLPRLTEIHLSAAGIAFAFGGALLIALFLGLVPIAGSPELDVNVLRDGGRGVTLSRRRQLVRSALVVSQVALSLVLITAAGLMVRSFQNLRAVRPGFDPSGVLTMHVAIPAERYGKDYARTSAFYEQVATQIRQLPGVRGVGFSEKIPLEDSNLCTGVSVQGSTARNLGCPSTSIVSPGYFEAMGIAVDGQSLSWSGMDQHDGNTVVSRAFAQQHEWPGTSGIGNGIKFEGAPFFRISGIAHDVLADGLDKPPVAIVYFPMLPIPGAQLEQVPTYMNLVVRTNGGDAMRLVPSIGRIVAELEPAAAIANAKLMNDVVARSMARRTFTMLLLGIAAAMAVLLSVVGLYGVVSYVVSQRRGEIAIRMALGAHVAQVRRMVVRQSTGITLVGIAAGLLVALGSMRLLQSLLFGVRATDPELLAGSALLLLAASLAASYLPARRASMVDPGDALRAE
jgi:putative ABC transport system permease protein